MYFFHNGINKPPLASTRCYSDEKTFRKCIFISKTEQGLKEKEERKKIPSRIERLETCFCSQGINFRIKKNAKAYIGKCRKL